MYPPGLIEIVAEERRRHYAESARPFGTKPSRLPEWLGALRRRQPGVAISRPPAGAGHLAVGPKS